MLTALGRAQATAYPAGEYVGQESFMQAAEVRRLAHQARVGPGVPVLDLCCGVAGPGRMIAAESGCRYVGVDQRPGLAVTWQQEYSSAHHAVATAQFRCNRADSAQIAGQIGEQATAELITAHQLWNDWLGSGRVRKFAMVAEKQ